MNHYYTQRINHLDSLQASKNGGRGIECVKSLIQLLRAGNPFAANAIYCNEHDKIVLYPDVDVLCQDVVGSIINGIGRGESNGSSTGS